MKRRFFYFHHVPGYVFLIFNNANVFSVYCIKEQKNTPCRRVFLVYPLGLEPKLDGVGGRNVIQLHYGYVSTNHFTRFFFVLQAFTSILSSFFCRQKENLVDFLLFTRFSLSFFASLCYNTFTIRQGECSVWQKPWSLG